MAAFGSDGRCRCVCSRSSLTIPRPRIAGAARCAPAAGGADRADRADRAGRAGSAGGTGRTGRTGRGGQGGERGRDGRDGRAYFHAPPDPALVEAAGRHLRSTPIELEVRKMAPDAGGVMRKIPADVLVETGWALARFGDGGWWPAVERGLDSGEFSDDVVAALADVVRRSGGVDWVTSVLSVRLGDVLARLGHRVADALSVPHLELVARADERPPQREMANAAQQAANVRGAFRVLRPPPGGVGVCSTTPHLWLDARDGRRPAPPRRRRSGGAAGAGHSAVALSSPIAGLNAQPFGLPGSDVLSRFGSVTIDYANKQLIPRLRSWTGAIRVPDYAGSMPSCPRSNARARRSSPRWDADDRRRRLRHVRVPAPPAARSPPR